MKNIFTFLFIFSISFCFGQTMMSIQDARSVDQEGSLLNLGTSVQLEGIAIGPNFRPSGYTFVLFDTASNIGITVFGFSQVSNYQVQDGDQLTVIGELAEFRGLAEIVPDSIIVNSSGNAIPEPEVVTTLNETTEAKLIKIENVSIVDTNSWGNADFNVDITNGVDTFEMRIDGDTDIAGMLRPLGTFDVVGVGGQFDDEEPLFSGYQIFPRSINDIDPYVTGGGPSYEVITLEQAREVDNEFRSSRLDQLVEVTGVVHGVNFRPGGLQFTIINDNNVGLGVFDGNNSVNYTFNAGDEITIQGRMAQFNGLTQINPDSLWVVSQGNDLVQPTEVDTLREMSESALVTIQMMGYVDPLDWAGDGSSFNVDYLTVNGDEVRVRIDEDTELASIPAPDGAVFITGIGGQFDGQAPFNSGYQLFPFSIDNFDPWLSTDDVYAGEVSISPNPVQSALKIAMEENCKQLMIYNGIGQLMFESKQAIDNYSLDLSDYPKGVYHVVLQFESGKFVEQIIKQ